MARGYKLIAAGIIISLLLPAAASCRSGLDNDLPAGAGGSYSGQHQNPGATSSGPTGDSQGFPEDWHLNEWIIHGIETMPVNAVAGKPVKIWTNIYSANNDYSFTSAFLIVNGKVLEDRKLVIPPDEDFPFLFEFTPGLPGSYDICVRIVCETKTECIDPFDTEAYLVDAFITIHITD